MSLSRTWASPLGELSWQLLFFELFVYFVCITHSTKFTCGSSLLMEKSFLMKKSKSEESPVKKIAKEERKSIILSRKEKKSPWWKRLVLAELHADVQISNKEVAVKPKFVKARFSFAWNKFAHYYVVLHNAPLSDRDYRKKVRCLQWVNFPRKSWPLPLTPGGPVVPLVCGFRSRDYLLAWRESFVNLYRLKPSI